VTRDELLARLAGLRQARVGQVRVPHKPLLLLWLFGQFAATGTSQATHHIPFVAAVLIVAGQLRAAKL
jgi:putative restriction endonuclease